MLQINSSDVFATMESVIEIMAARLRNGGAMIENEVHMETELFGM